ncbi:MAG: hypothetical protein US62_C0046G0004 [Candidatus Woesebacteria bacterium GW2011_GWA1_37_8]|uniref:Uncharacterized protein n=2 Tax=Candidatus Woeseibacteriota TaxID=1752722 RepID=A0A0G0NM39_9BACT|nr:MAG: hypothetical protein US62_C0046G0004 [Candidatus Woesebacteria bacterium GW2011_GWA1_37_8]KKQ86984.1 MAG: hypothetical protein UT10_C0013G0033 [Candidatus Woesebacteria bacterium GW2011_GWB1_38_8b]
MRKEFTHVSLQTPQGIIVELIGPKEIQLTYPSGKKETLTVPKKAPEGISALELMALTTSRLVIPLASDEMQGVDQAGYQTRREDGVHDLPGRREGFYEDALIWAGSVLQGKRWRVEKVTGILMGELGEQVEAGKQLSVEGQQRYQVAQARLNLALTEYFPGARAAIERRRKKPAPRW